MYVPKLTHEQRKERRRKIAEAVEAGKAKHVVAVEFGVSVATVYDAVEEHEIERSVGPRPVTVHPSVVVTRSEWEAADWTRRDADLATHFGVSRQRVQQVRVILGKAKVSKIGATGTVGKVIRWVRENREAVAGLWAQDVVDLLPFPARRHHIRVACAKLGINLRSRVDALAQMTRDNVRTFVADVPGRMETACWEWQGQRYPRGYGNIGGVYAHRRVFELFNGPIPTGLWCLHKCDNPACVNPDHLYAGTPADNARDREERGRGNHPGGLTPEQAGEVRRDRMLSHMPLSKLAKKYGVSVRTIYKALRQPDNATAA